MVSSVLYQLLAGLCLMQASGEWLDPCGTTLPPTTRPAPTTTPCTTTTLAPTTLPLTCAALVCPSPMVMKPEPEKMVCTAFSGECSVSYCCVMPTTTPAPTEAPPVPTTPAPTTTPCTPTTAPYTCATFACPSGYITIEEPEKEVCDSVQG